MSSIPTISRALRPASASDQTPESEWLATARKLGDQLRLDIAERDRAGGVPHDQITWLKDADLLTLLIPTDLGGKGARWSETAEVVREIAAVDSSIAHVLLYHYFGSLAGTTGRENGRVGTARAQRIAAENLFHGTVAQAAYPPLIEAVPDGDGFILRGSKPFSSGAALGDVLLVWAQFADGSTLDGKDVSGQLATFTVDVDPARVRYEHDWDNVGQRLSVSGTTTLDDVPVGPDEVIHYGFGVEPTYPDANLDVIFMFSGFASIFTGIAIGALREATEYLRERGRPWVESSHERAGDDPLIRERLGRLWVLVESAIALNDRSTSLVDQARELGSRLTWEERGEVVTAVNASRVHSSEVALEVTTRLFEITGARSTTAGFGLDRFWRNARTLSLHDPLQYKQVQLGAWVLQGETPEPGFYS